MKYIIAVLGILFLALILWAMSIKPIWESSDLLLGDPWGLVTLADLYLGFVIFSLFVFKTAKSKKNAVLITSLLLFLGNIVSVFYVIWYLTVKSSNGEVHANKE